MKHFALLMFLVGFYCTPVSAQNASQIAAVQDGKSCAGCNLFQANLAYQDASKMDLSNARLRQANLSLATYDDVDFSRANLSVANLFGARFNRATLAVRFRGHTIADLLDQLGEEATPSVPPSMPPRG